MNLAFFANFFYQVIFDIYQNFSIFFFKNLTFFRTERSKRRKQTSKYQLILINNDVFKVITFASKKILKRFHIIHIVSKVTVQVVLKWQKLYLPCSTWGSYLCGQISTASIAMFTAIKLF